MVVNSNMTAAGTSVVRAKSIIFTSARRQAGVATLLQQCSMGVAATDTITRRLVSSVATTTGASVPPSLSSHTMRRQQVRLSKTPTTATKASLTTYSVMIGSTRPIGRRSQVLLDIDTLHHIKQDLVQVQGDYDEGDNDGGSSGGGGRIGLEELQRLLLLYPETFTEQDAETIGDLWYVGKSNGHQVSHLAFLRGLLHVLTTHQRNKGDSNDSNCTEHFDEGRNSNPLHLEGVPTADTCWGGSRFAYQPRFGRQRIQQQFDEYLLRYVQAAQNRAAALKQQEQQQEHS